MGIYQYTDSQTGKTYNFEHAGEAPTPEDWAFMQQHISADRQQRNQQSQQTFGVPMLPEDDSWALGRALDVGKTSAYSALGTTARDIGEATGFDWLQNLGAGMEQTARGEQLREATQLPAPTGFADVRQDWRKLPTFLGEVAGQSIPEMGATLGATALGTLVGGPAVGFAAGIATATPFFYGRNIQRQEDQIAAGELAGKDRMDAFLAAGGSAVLNTIGDKLLLTGKLFGLNIPLSEKLFVRMGQSAVTGAVTEAPTEIMQQVLERAQAGLPLDSDEAIQEYIEVGVAAGLLGGAIGGGTGPFRARETDTGGTPPPDTGAGTPPAAPAPEAPSAPSISDVEPALPGFDQDLEAQLAAEEATAEVSQRTTALLNALGVSPNSAMRKRLATANAAPDSPETLAELEKYAAVHAGNTKLMEVNPDTPQRIKEYIATVAAPKETPSAQPVRARTSAKYVVSTEDAGEIPVQVIRLPDGSATVFTDTSTQDYPAAFAESKSDEDLLSYQLEPLGYKGAAPKETPSAQPEPTAGAQPAPEATNADTGTRPTAGTGADVPSPARRVGVSGVGPSAGPDTTGAVAPDVGPVGASSAPAPDAAVAAGTPSPAVEQTAAGTQGVIPGVAPLTEGQRAVEAARRADEARKAAAKPADEGLFATPAAERDLVEMAKAEPVVAQPKQPGPERAQKYPLSNTIGGIKRGSRLAKEIEGALGVMPGRLPSSMYAKAGSGIAEVDEVVPVEKGPWQYAINIDETGNAFDQTDFINALIEEANGNPRLVGRQAELEAARREKEETARATELGYAPDATPMPEQADYYVPPRNQDISTDGERYDSLVAAVNRALRDTGRTLTQEEYAAVNDQLFNEGGSVTEAINAIPRAAEPAAPMPGFDAEFDSAQPTMTSEDFNAWLDNQVGTALNTEEAPAPNRRRTANKKAGAKVSKRFAWRPAKAEVEAEAAVEDAKRRWDNELAVAWEAKLATLPAPAREEVRAFVAEPGDIDDPTTAGDRKAVSDIVRVKRISPADKKLPGMENAEAAKNYFDKFPTVAEGLQLLARDLGSDPKVTKLIDNKRKAQEAGALPDWGEASSFLDANVGPKVAEKAVDWVQKNLSPAANKYLQNEVSRMKRLEKAARRRVTKYAPTEASRMLAEDKARAVIDEAVRAGKQVQGIKATQEVNAAAAGIANAEAVAEAWAVDKTRVSVPNLPEAVTASREELAGVKRPSIPRKKGETGADYAIRVMRPDFTPEQIKALSTEERLTILADAKASWDFLGGALYSKVQTVRQKYQMHQPLDQIAINALRNGQLESALRYVADRIQDPQIAALALAIAKNIRGTKVAVINASHPDLLVEEAKALRDSYGLYYPKHDTIVLNEDIGLTTSTLIHEALHAVTLAELRKPNSQLRAELQKVFDSVIDEISIYMPGQLTVEEFVAEVKTNPELRTRLAQLDAKGRNLPPQSFGKSVLDWVKTLLGKFVKAIGRNTGTPSALQTADFLIDMAITPDRNDGADFLYSKNLGAGNSAMMDDIRGLTEATASSAQNTRQQWADDASKYVDVGGTKVGKLLLSLIPTLAVGDFAAKVGIKDPYKMLKTVQSMNSEYDRAIERVNYMREAFNRLPKAQRRILDALMPASSVESTDLTLDRDTYSKWWLAYETVDSKGEITGRKRVKFNSALDRDLAVARLNANTPATRTSARAAHDPDPTQLKAYDTLKRVFDNELSPEGRAMYASMRDFYQQEYDALWETLQGNISAALPGDPAMAAEMKKSAYLMIFGKGEITPYFPLVREGDFWLEFQLFNPTTQSTEVVKKTFASPNERTRFLAKLAENPNVARNTDGSPVATAYTAADVAANNFADKSMFVADTMQLLTRYQAKHAGTDKAISNDTIQEIAQALVEAAPEGALAKQFHRRRNVAGYTESADLALQQKGYKLASSAARFRYGRAIRNLQQEYSTLAKGNPNTKQQLVLNELVAFGDNALKPQNSLAERAARVANKVTYAYTLLGSPASALVNLSGMANVIFPQLGGTYGWGATTSAMTRASRDFVGSGYRRTGELPVAIDGQTTETLKSMPSLDNYYVLGKNGDYEVNRNLGFTNEQIARAEALLPLMQELGDRGMSHKSQFFDSAGLEEMGRTRSLVDRAMAFFGVPFHMVERMNRQVTAMAVYDLELARMDQKPTPAEALMSPAEKQAKAAQEAVYQAQYLNGSASMNTAPRLTQRGVGRVMFMYKNYGITVSTVLYKSAKQLAENMYGGNKELRNQAMKQLVGHTGITFLMAGAAGLPLYGLYAMIGNAFRDDDELTVEEATRLWMNELAYKGVINHVTGFEVADRVGLSGLLYRANRFNTDPTAEETIVQTVLGAPWATASRIKRGVVDLMSGEVQRGIESMVPVAITNVLQAARFYNEGGIRTRQGNFMYEDPSAMELFGKLIGFNMAEYVRLQARASEMSRISKAVSDKRTKLMTELFVASRAGDTAGVRRAYEKIAEFNRTTAVRYPGTAITPRGIEQSFERRQRGVEEMVNGVTVNPQVRPVLVQQYNAMVDGITRY